MRAILLFAVLFAFGVSHADAQVSREQFCEKRFTMKSEEIKSGRVLGLLVPSTPFRTFEAMYRNVNGDRWTSCTCFVETGCDCCKVDEAKYCAYTEHTAKTTQNVIRAGCAWERG